MDISIAEAHNRLSYWLRKVQDGQLIRITNRGKPVGVIMDPDEYDKLRQVQAYLQMLNYSSILKDGDMTAQQLYRASRDELEGNE